MSASGYVARDSWSQKKKLKLIKKYKGMPLLWDSNNPDYGRRPAQKRKRAKALQKLAKYFKTTKDVIERKIRDLQTVYSREKQKVKSDWYALKAMAFLTPTISTVNPEPSTSSSIGHADNIQLNIIAHSISNVAINMNTSSEISFNTIRNVVSEVPLDYSNNNTSGEETEKNDECNDSIVMQPDQYSLFGERIASKLRLLPSLRAENLQIDIMKLVNEAYNVTNNNSLENTPTVVDLDEVRVDNSGKDGEKNVNDLCKQMEVVDLTIETEDDDIQFVPNDVNVQFVPNEVNDTPAFSAEATDTTYLYEDSNSVMACSPSSLTESIKDFMKSMPTPNSVEAANAADFLQEPFFLFSPAGPPERYAFAGSLNFSVRPLNSGGYPTESDTIVVDIQHGVKLLFEWDHFQQWDHHQEWDDLLTLKMRVRVTTVFVDEEHHKERPRRCVQHRDINEDPQKKTGENVFISTSPIDCRDVFYCGMIDDDYCWYSVVVEYNQWGGPKTHEFKFICREACSSGGGIARRKIALVVSLEDEFGKVYGRQVLNAVVVKPACSPSPLNKRLIRKNKTNMLNLII